MTHTHGRRRRYRSLATVVVTLLALLLPAGAAGARGPALTVMTRNLYLGTGLFNAVGVTSRPELVAAVTLDWANVLATDFRTRAGALADEIIGADAGVVGLQEVTLWRDQAPSDLLAHPAPNATHVVLDLLAILQARLAARGVPYTAVSVSTNADLEAPRRGEHGLVDVRITDRDVLLVRTDAVHRTSNARHGHYRATLTLPSLPRPVRNTRGWVSVDYRVGGTTVRVLDTHLEVGSPEDAAAVQAAQGRELLDLVAASPHPVIVLGDGNSPADGSGTGTYARLTAVLHDAWLEAGHGDPGPTCCQVELLDNAVGRERVRIDLVLTSENWPVGRVVRTGETPFRKGPAPLWASDHFGVTARFTLR